MVQTVIVEQPREVAQPHESVARGLNSTSTSTGSHQGDTTETVKVLRTGSVVVPLAEGSLPTTPDGATVSVTVVPAADGSRRVLSATTLSAPVAAAIPATRRVYVALVVPKGVPADARVTNASTRAMVTRVSGYWSDQTGGQVSFATSAIEEYQSAYTCSGTYDMWAEAQARMPQAAGPGGHLIVVVPGGAWARGCAYGLGTVGGLSATRNLVFVSGLGQSLLAHELGHNLGLYHSNSLRCSGAQDRPMRYQAFPGCQAEAYDDLFDVMGYSGASYGEGNLNAVHLDGMKLLPNAVRRIAAGTGVTTVRIAPLSTRTNNRALKVTDSSGVSYFVEYRTNSGRDAVAAINPNRPSWGVRVMREDPVAPTSAGSYELDATPTRDSDDYDRSIPVGGVFTAASRRLTISVIAASSTGATLTIANRASAVAPSRVTLSVPATASVGTPITTSARVTDQHGVAVPSWPVTLQKLLRGTTTWRSVRSLLTTSTGTASYRFANGLSGSYRWVTEPGYGNPARVSQTMAVASTARVTQVRPAASVVRGKYLSVSGIVSPVPSPVVYIQYRFAGGDWRNGALATVKGTVVSGRIALSTRTTAYTRLSVRAATSYEGSTSGYYVTQVR